MSEAPELLSPEAVEQLQAALAEAAEQPAAAQGFLSNIPDLSAVGGFKDKVVGAIVGVLGAIDTIQQYSWIIPPKYQEPLQKFEDALRKVQGWLG
jgi:hypothetical protein